VNGAAYAILICFGIYILSYWTFQVGSGERDPRGMRILNRMGEDLQKTGFHKVARTLDSLPDSYYRVADLVGFSTSTPAGGRLSRYPAFLSLVSGRISRLWQDSTFTKMRMSKEPIMELLKYQTWDPMMQNPETVNCLEHDS